MITGAASGFGFETAKRCVIAGMRTALLDVSAQELADAEKTLKALATNGADRVVGVRCNVTQPEELCSSRDQVKNRFSLLGQLTGSDPGSWDEVQGARRPEIRVQFREGCPECRVEFREAPQNSWQASMNFSIQFFTSD